VNLADIEIINESQYNLLIKFKLDYNIDHTNHDINYQDVKLLKDESKTITIVCFSGPSIAVDPNDDVLGMLFMNSDNGIIIKDLKNDKEYFQYTGGDEYQCYYKLIVSDDLLR
jgi:hypothetical protein